MQVSDFNLVDVASALQKKWKTIAIIVLLALVATAITLFIVPKHYKSQSIAIVQNPLMADKSRWFNNNIQNLYSFLGDGDDLDMVYGLSKLDMVYYQLVDEFNLTVHYDVEGKTPEKKRYTAFLVLKDELDITKNETNLLKVTAFDKDAYFAAKLANRATELIQLMQQSIWKRNYVLLYDHLNASIDRMEKQVLILSDSVKLFQPNDVQQLLLLNKRQSLLDEIQKYRKEATEFQLIIETIPAALIVLDKASPSTISARPDKVLVLSITFFVALFFAMALILFIEGRKK